MVHRRFQSGRKVERHEESPAGVDPVRQGEDREQDDGREEYDVAAKNEGQLAAPNDEGSRHDDEKPEPQVRAALVLEPGRIRGVLGQHATGDAERAHEEPGRVEKRWRVRDAARRA